MPGELCMKAWITLIACPRSDTDAAFEQRLSSVCWVTRVVVNGQDATFLSRVSRAAVGSPALKSIKRSSTSKLARLHAQRSDLAATPQIKTWLQCSVLYLLRGISSSLHLEYPFSSTTRSIGRLLLTANPSRPVPTLLFLYSVPGLRCTLPRALSLVPPHQHTSEPGKNSEVLPRPVRIRNVTSPPSGTTK